MEQSSKAADLGIHDKALIISPSSYLYLFIFIDPPDSLWWARSAIHILFLLNANNHPDSCGFNFRERKHDVGRATAGLVLMTCSGNSETGRLLIGFAVKPCWSNMREHAWSALLRLICYIFHARNNWMGGVLDPISQERSEWLWLARLISSMLHFSGSLMKTFDCKPEEIQFFYMLVTDKMTDIIQRVLKRSTYKKKKN